MTQAQQSAPASRGSDRAAVAGAADEAVPATPREPVSDKKGYWQSARSQPAVIVSLVYVALFVAVAVFAPLIAPYAPGQGSLSEAFQTPSLNHLLGTDDVGRDVFSRIVYATRIVLLDMGIGVGVAVAVGVPIGLVAGYRPGSWFDRIAGLGTDIMFALPGIVMLMAVAAIIGNDLVGLMTAVGITLAPSLMRLTRDSVVSQRTLPYVEAARVLGFRHRAIMLKEILPNSLTPVIVQMFVFFGVALLIEASLSFVGLGADPSTPSVGSLLATAQAQMLRAPSLVIAPGVFVVLIVVALTTIGDSIQRHVDGSTVAAPTPAGRRRPASRPAVSASQQLDAADSEIALKVRGLDLALDRRGAATPVVSGLSITLRRGSTLGIVGESGSGKTLTGLALLGLQPSTVGVRGSIEIGGMQIVGAPRKTLQAVRGSEVGMVFQDPHRSLHPSLTVGRQLREVIRLHQHVDRKVADTRARQLLQQVQITDPDRVMHSYPHHLSGGMAQRVAIARALAATPGILVLDEPTTALDVTVQKEILTLLQQLQAERELSIVLISHDIGVISEVCSEICVMYAGEIVEHGSADEVLLTPAHPYTRALLDSIPSTGDDGESVIGESVQGTAIAPGEWPSGCRFVDRCPLAIAECAMAHPSLAPAAGAGHTARCIVTTRAERL